MTAEVDGEGLGAAMGAASCSDAASSAAPPAQPAPEGSASSSGGRRAAGSLDASKFGAQSDELLQQTVAQLAAGQLRIHARVVSTQNAIEETLAVSKIVTKFIIEVQQLGFKWEVARRYSEFAAFNEELSASWAMPELPPKLFQNEETDIVRAAVQHRASPNVCAARVCPVQAERMLRLDAYLKELLAQPALMLSLPARAAHHPRPTTVRPRACAQPVRVPCRCASS